MNPNKAWVYQNREAVGRDDKWSVYCTVHQWKVNVRTRSFAEGLARPPLKWCPECCPELAPK